MQTPTYTRSGIEVQIRRPDGGVEEVVEIASREPARDIQARLVPLADLYAGTGYSAYLVIDGMATLVGEFHA